MYVSKGMIVNAVALTLIALSFVLNGALATLLLFAGLFAFSGALTNQLAIHMLFEKVPLIYGSGVIEARFEAFKSAIKTMMMEEFFTREKLDAFFAAEEKKIDLAPILEKTDFSPAYDALSKSVMESSFGGMLGMFGGEKALEGLREPFTNKLRNSLIAIADSEAFDRQLQEHLQNSSLSDDLIETIETMIEKRLDELTPIMVKEMVEALIREHLGWLVVWGGVFGGLIGIVSSFVLYE